MTKGCILSLQDEMDKYERTIIVLALELRKYNKTHTAEALGITRPTLYDKMNKLDIPKYQKVYDSSLKTNSINSLEREVSNDTVSKSYITIIHTSPHDNTHETFITRIYSWLRTICNSI